MAQFGALDRSHLQEVAHFIFYLFMSWISDSNTAEVKAEVGWSLNLMDLQDVQRYCIFHEKRTKSSLVISYGTDAEDRILEKTTEALLKNFLSRKLCSIVMKTNQKSVVHYQSILQKSIKSSSNWKAFLARKLHPPNNFQVPWKKASKGILLSL